MSDPNSDDTPRNLYLSTNERKEAVDAIEMTARFLEEAKENPDRWKWVMIALLNAVQAFMVLALQGTWNVLCYVTISVRGNCWRNVSSIAPWRLAMKRRRNVQTM